MRWRAKIRRVLPDVAWACLVLAVAAYGAAIVRNITDAMIDIRDKSHAMVVVQRPNR
jgi:hypothetical protein